RERACLDYLDYHFFERPCWVSWPCENAATSSNALTYQRFPPGWLSAADSSFAHRPETGGSGPRLVDDADMGSDDSPTLGEAYPGLHLPPHLAGQRVAIEQGRGNRGVAAVGRDHGPRDPAR